MTRVLLFGASGFIGSHVLDALAEDTRIGEVICPGRDRFDLINGDVAGLTALLRAASPDVVISCVGRLGGTESELIGGNTLVAAKLIEAVAAAAPSARLVRLGSAGEYGPVPHGRSVTEDDPENPVAAYGLSHLAATRLFRLAGESGRVDAVSIRVFNPIGAGLSTDTLLGKAVHRLRLAVTEGAVSIPLGPLGSYRDFVDVHDVASLMLAVVLAGELRHRVYNAGSGRAVTAREAVAALAERAGYTGTIRETGIGPQRSAAVDWIRADIERARTDFGWSPVYDLATSSKDIWDAGESG
jgi:nucleoside-diphosphate-sugar epimerase